MDDYYALRQETAEMVAEAFAPTIKAFIKSAMALNKVIERIEEIVSEFASKIGDIIEPCIDILCKYIKAKANKKQTYFNSVIIQKQNTSPKSSMKRIYHCRNNC